MGDNQLLTYSVHIELPWRSGNGIGGGMSVVIWCIQTGSNEQCATVDNWRGLFGNNNGPGSVTEISTALSGEPISLDVGARYKKSAPDPRQPWWQAPLKVHSVDIGGYPNGDDGSDDPRWRPSCIYIGSEDLITEKTAKGYPPDNWLYTVLNIYIAYWPNPVHPVVVTPAAPSTQGRPM